MSRLSIVTFCLCGSVMLFAVDRTNLTGKVTDTAGKPLAHATVMVYHAGVKRGYSTFCPSCYTDCGKRALTDESGAFTLNGLSRDLWFELLVIHDGYGPLFVDKVDPARGPAPTAALAARIRVDDPTRELRGRVINPHGRPVRDAVVTPQGVLLARGGGTAVYAGFGNLAAVTDEKGEFEISNTEPFLKIALMVEPRAMATKFIVLPAGSERRTVAVSDGALVRGRLVENGKPVAGAEIGLAPRQEWLGAADLKTYGSPYSEIRIGTSEDGSFAITGVPVPEEWNIYAKMESISSHGATDPTALTTTHDKQEINVGDIPIKRGYHLRGKVVLSDHKPIPDGMQIFIVSKRVRDTQTVSLANDGRFEFSGLAAGDYSLSPMVKGYKLAKNTTEIKASISDELANLIIVLDPDTQDSTQRQ